MTQTAQARFPDKEMFAAFCGQNQETLVTISRRHGVTYQVDGLLVTFFGAQAGEAVQHLKTSLFQPKRRISGPAVPHTPGQAALFEALRRWPVTFCDGPPKTGKTRLTLDFALTLLKDKRIERVLLTAPGIPISEDASSAGAVLAFDERKNALPASMESAYQTLTCHYTPTTALSMIETGVVCALPMALLHGLSLEKTFLVIDHGHLLRAQDILCALGHTHDTNKVAVLGDSGCAHPDSALPFLQAFTRLESTGRAGLIRLTPQDCYGFEGLEPLMAAYLSVDAPVPSFSQKTCP